MPSVVESGDELQEIRYLEVLKKINLLITPQKELQSRSPVAEWKAHSSKYLEALKLDQDLSQLSVIHVAGTKGKGSTCAMVDSILQACGYTTGRFTSPHLSDIRERICISGHWVEKGLFTSEAEWCLARLEGLELPMPTFFRFMTLLALRVFVQTNVDAVVLEVGLGGRLDATNIVKAPVVCGISMLGYDHMDVLGDTLREISIEKAGIFKKGSLAFTVPQKEEAMTALKEKADEIGITLHQVKPLTSYTHGEDVISKLGVSYQAQNAALAVALACEWEKRQTKITSVESSSRERCLKVDRECLPAIYKRPLMTFEWPGRSQILVDRTCPEGCLQFYLDGAHTVESMDFCGQWFGRHNSTGNTWNILWFNCTGGRDHYELFAALQRSLLEQNCPIQQAVFTPLNSSKSTLTPKSQSIPIDLSAQVAQREAWKQVHRKLAPRSVLPRPPSSFNVPSVQSSLSAVLASLRKAVKANPAHPVRVLVTGSLYLVGDVLQLFETKPAKAG